MIHKIQYIINYYTIKDKSYKIGPEIFHRRSATRYDVRMRNSEYAGFKADTDEGFCSRGMLQAHFARVSTHEGAFSNSVNLRWELTPKYLTG